MSYAKFLREKNSFDQPHKENKQVIVRNMLSIFVYSNVYPGSIAHKGLTGVTVKGRDVHPFRLLSNLGTSFQIKGSILCLDMN